MIAVGLQSGEVFVRTVTRVTAIVQSLAAGFLRHSTSCAAKPTSISSSDAFPSVSSLLCRTHELLKKKETKNEAIVLIHRERDVQIAKTGNPIFSVPYLGVESRTLDPKDSSNAEKLRALTDELFNKTSSLPVARVEKLTLQEQKEIFFGLNLLRISTNSWLKPEEALAISDRIEQLAWYQLLLHNIPSRRMAITSKAKDQPTIKFRVEITLPPTWITLNELKPYLKQIVEKRNPHAAAILDTPLNAEYEVQLDLLVSPPGHSSSLRKAIKMAKEKGTAEGTTAGGEFYLKTEYGTVGNFEGLVAQMKPGYAFLTFSGPEGSPSDRCLTYLFSTLRPYPLSTRAWSRYKRLFMAAKLEKLPEADAR